MLRDLSVVQRELEANSKSQIICCNLSSFLSVLGGFLQALSSCCCQNGCRFCADETKTDLKNLLMKTRSGRLSDPLACCSPS